ncbi:MAG: class I SAM-dependent methyltransferase [archaeon]
MPEKIPKIPAAEYYDAIAQSYDRLYGEEQIHKAKLIRRRLKITATTNLLDVGCGTAIYSQLFDCTYTGIDPSEKLLFLAETHNPAGTFVLGTAESLPFAKGSFDIVIAITSLHHTNGKTAIEEIHRVLKPRKILVTNTPDVRCAISVQKKSLKMKELEHSLREVFAGWKIEQVLDEKDVVFFIS